MASGVASGVATGVTGADMEGIGDGSQALGVASKTRKRISRNNDSLNLSAFQVSFLRKYHPNKNTGEK